jgi:formylglycine-generating enzyme required for sulfatase activity
MRSAAFLLIFAFSLTAFQASPLHAADAELVAVMDLQPVEARPAEALAITNQLRTHLLKTGKFTLVDRSQMEEILKEQALQQTGCTSEECAVQVGKLLGVRKIVAGSVTKLSDQLWQVSVLVLDVETAQTLQAETETYEGNLLTVIRGGVPDLAARLAGTGRPPATPVAISPPATAAPKAGDIFREPITGMEFVYVPGGEYEQGCGIWTSDCFPDEKPTRQVRLSPFWIGKTEVTQGQWKRVTGSNPAKFQKGDDYPVEQVSWNDAQEFIKQLNAQSGQTYRLPTEAEWEFACRAGGKPVKYGTRTGELSASLAKYDSLDGAVRTGSFAPNGLGLHDMSGNVREWTQDVYSAKAYQSGLVADPNYQGSGAHRVYRGGGWDGIPRLARCSVRSRGSPSKSASDLGFRLLRTPQVSGSLPP